MKCIINAVAAKNMGGGFQVAINFIIRTLTEPFEIEWYYLLAEPMAKVLESDLYLHKIPSDRVFVFPSQPDFKNTYFRVSKQIQDIEKHVEADVMYTIIAQSFIVTSTTEVMRFTYPWMTNPNKYAKRLLTKKERIRMRIHDWIVLQFLKRCSYFITQTETAKDGIINLTGQTEDHVKVIANTLPSSFLSEERINNHTSYTDIACIGGPSKHKNFEIIPNVIFSLINNFGHNDVRFHVTIPEDTPIWASIKSKARELNVLNHIINYGKVCQKELANIYRNCSISYLPSLLEVFSATPLESMYFGLYIVATDLSFNRDVMADSALYCDPEDYNDAAEKIHQLIAYDEIRNSLNEAMIEQLKRYNDFDSYYRNTIDYLRLVVQNEN